MINWLKSIFGFGDPLKKKKAELAALQERAFQAQRAGDLRTAGKWLQKAELLETEIVEAMNEGR